MLTLRLLVADDAPELFAVRLDALRTDPDAFLAEYEEERQRGVDWFADRLRDGERDPACGVIGAFDGDALIGFVGFVRAPRRRVRHTASIWGTWVAPTARRRGIARRLMEAALDHLRGIDGIERVTLSVTTGQTAASALYRALGFEPYGLEARAMKVGERYLDEQLLVRRLP